MRRVGGAIALIVGALTLMVEPAVSQNSSAWLGPESPEPGESAGEVVITVTMWRAGRVMYRTFDGLCTVGYSPGGTPAEPQCRDDKKASAPSDYTAVSGELVFTAGGVKTITIPLVDDALAEGEEGFTVAAWEDANADPWLPRGDSKLVRIVDDEAAPRGGSSAPPGTAPSPAAGPSTSTAPTGGQSSAAIVHDPEPTAPRVSDASDPPTTTTVDAAPPSPAVEAASPDGGIHPGPGFELTSESVTTPIPESEGPAGGLASGAAIGSAAVALAVGAVAVERRRRRWSPTRA